MPKMVQKEKKKTYTVGMPRMVQKERRKTYIVGMPFIKKEKNVCSQYA